MDHFKAVNDTHGHQVGDLVLKETCALIKRSVRGSDIVARYGGEEIIILLRTPYLDAATKTAEELRYKIESLDIVSDDGKTYKASISIGISKFMEGDTEKSLIKRADDGLYLAKGAGRNCCRTVEEGGLK